MTWKRQNLVRFEDYYCLLNTTVAIQSKKEFLKLLPDVIVYRFKEYACSFCWTKRNKCSFNWTLAFNWHPKSIFWNEGLKKDRVLTGGQIGELQWLLTIWYDVQKNLSWMIGYFRKLDLPCLCEIRKGEFLMTKVYRNPQSTRYRVPNFSGLVVLHLLLAFEIVLLSVDELQPTIETLLQKKTKIMLKI